MISLLKGKIEFSKKGSKNEMTQLRIFSPYQLESILYVPEIIKNTIYKISCTHR